MVEKRDNPVTRHGLRVAAGLAVAAVGASVVYDRYGRVADRVAAEEAGDGSGELAIGRGEATGPVATPSLEAGYEVEDTNVRGIVIVMAVAIVLMVLGVGLVFRMYAGFDRHFLAANSGLTAIQRTVIVPPAPHLQAEPYRDIDALIMEQKRRIESYGWTDSTHRRAHIPIERAMQRVVGKPLDDAAQADASGSPGTEMRMPILPTDNAAMPQNKPANRVQGEGRAGAIAPSYQPPPETKP